MTEAEVQLLRSRLSALHRRLRRETPPLAGLSRSAVRVLGSVARHDGGRRPGDVAEDLVMATSNVATALGELERAGFVERWRDDEDARVVRVVLTEAGAGIVARTRALRAEWLGAAMAALLDDEERALLLRAGELVDRLARYEPGAP